MYHTPHIKQKFTYLGIDETTFGLSRSRNIILVAAETLDERLAMDHGISSLKKTADYLNDACISDYDETLPIADFFPSINELYENGLNNFHWMRCNGGRFNRAAITHAGIAHLITCNNYEPKKTVVHIDTFNQNTNQSKSILLTYLKESGFNMPKENIHFWCSGDKCVPIINYADILAFHIGLYINKKYKKYFPNKFDINLSPLEVPFDKKRLEIPLSENDRSLLEKVIKKA